MNEQPKKLNKLQQLLNSLVEESLTKEEFIESFQTIFKQLLELEKKLIIKIDSKTDGKIEEIENLQKEFRAIIEQTGQESDSTFGGIRKRSIELINSLFEKSDVRKKLLEALNKVEEKLTSLRDGKDADEQKIIDEVLAKVPPQKEPEEIKAEQIRDKLEILTGNERLKIDAIDELKEKLEDLEKMKRVGGGGGFSAIALNFHMVDDESPIGTPNGVLTTFTIAHAPSPIASLKVFVNGLKQKLTDDYTFSGTTITFLIAPPTNSIILCDYRI